MGSSYLHAQNKLTGKIIDSSFAPVSYANVALLKSDSSFVKGGVSDDNGDISILVPEGIILIQSGRFFEKSFKVLILKR